MLSILAKPWLYSIALALALLAPHRAGADDRFSHHRLVDRIVVFGDSLSDPGNAFALNGGQIVAPPDYGMTTLLEVIQLVPEAPYASRRFSNGPTWIEILAGTIGLGASVKPAFTGSDGRASNYAVGGATAFGAGPTDLNAQVDFFLRDVGGRAPADALYVIEFGGNDVRAILAGQDPALVIGGAMASIAQNVGKLHHAGARRFLIWSAPDLGRTPALQRLNTFVAPGIAGIATDLSGFYNQNLQGVLQGLGALPDIAIVPFDAFGLLADVQAHPARFGLRDATNACIQPNVPELGFPSAAPFRCLQQDRFFFWDGIHPTRAGHAIIAFFVGKTLVTAVLQDD